MDMHNARDPRPTLPAGFRKLSRTERSARMLDHIQASALERTLVAPSEDALELADVMVESAVGVMAVPLGVASGVLVDGVRVDVPMATEEPSVIAAATYGARIVAGAGGFSTWADPPMITGQVFVEGCDRAAVGTLERSRETILAAARGPLIRMEARGGGLRRLDTAYLPETGLVRLQLHIDVRDAMGANTADSVAEAVRPVVEELTGGRVLMAILTNSGAQRRAGARFVVPVSSLARGDFDGATAAARIETASRLAQEDPSRAVTHNKGIMNGVTAIALATGNDTRGLEAAVHAYAARSGIYRGLSTFTVRGEMLEGQVELPMPLGTVGGAAGMHPASAASLRLLGSPGATMLARIAAAVGLGQNLSALFALVTDGIQRGHMRLHERRVAWLARLSESGIPERDRQ